MSERTDQELIQKQISSIPVTTEKTDNPDALLQNPLQKAELSKTENPLQTTDMSKTENPLQTAYMSKTENLLQTVGLSKVKYLMSADDTMSSQEKEHLAEMVKLSSGIAFLNEKIQVSTEEAFAKRPALELHKLEKPNEDAMGQGARSYLKTLLSNDLLKNVNDSDRELIIDKVIANFSELIEEYSRPELMPASAVERLSTIISGRLLPVDGLVAALAKTDGYKDYYLDNRINGKTCDSYDVYIGRRKLHRLSAAAYLDGCTEYQKDRQYHLKITGLKGDNSKGSDAATRGRDRFLMMSQLSPMIKTLFESLNTEPPKTLYKFREDELSSKKIKDKGSKGFKSKYKDYLDVFFKDLIKSQKSDNLNREINFMGKTYSTWTSVCKLIKDNYSIYGVDHDVDTLSELMGDDMSEKSKDKFLEKISIWEDKYLDNLNKSGAKEGGRITDDMKHYLAKIFYSKDAFSAMEAVNSIKIVLSFQFEEDGVTKNVFKENSKKFNQRISDFKTAYGDKLIGLFLEDDRFLEHIIADTDEQYNNFMDHVAPSLSEVFKELGSHTYFDQYLIEKKIEICDFILSGKKDHVKEILKLDELDKKIEATKIGSTTFKKILQDKIGATDKSEKKKIDSATAIDQSAVLEAITLMGAEVVLDDKLLAKALAKSTKKTGQEIQPEEKAKQKTTPSDADLKAWKEKGRMIVNKKKDGRKLYNEIFSTTHAHYEKVDDTWLENPDIEPGYLSDLKELMQQSEYYKSDSFLEAFFSTMTKKLILDAEENNMDFFTSDMKALLNVRAFSVAADKAFNETDISYTERFSLKTGLFELNADLLIYGTAGDIDSYYDIIRDTLSQKEGDLNLLAYIRDDNGEMEGISYDYALGESKTSKSQRNTFENQLKKHIGKETAKIFENFTEDEKILVAYVMQNRRDYEVTKKTLQRITQTDESSDDIADSVAFLQYLKGERITDSVLSIDYVNLSKSLTLKKSWKTEADFAVRLVEEAKSINEITKNLVDVKAKDKLLDASLIEAEFKRARKTIGLYMYDISNDKLMSGKEKLWRVYTLFRSYSDVFDNYRKQVDLGIIDYDPKAYKSYPEAYALLAEYFSTNDKNSTAVQRLYNARICNLVGIFSDTEFKNIQYARELERADELDRVDELIWQRISEDESKETATATIRKYLDDKTGEKHKAKKLFVDPDEKLFPPQVVEHVREIDRWIAENSLKWKGDSTSNFSVEILGYPMRERLFIYYLIEHGKEKTPAELDCIMSVTGYIPDIDVFTQNLKTSKFSTVISYTRGFVKYLANNSLDVLDSFGKIAGSKIESGMRMLDSTKWEFSELLQKTIDDRRDYSEKDLPKEVKIRESCFISLIGETVKLTELTKGLSEEKIQKDPKIILQAERTQRSLRRLMKANNAVGKLVKDDEFAEKYGKMEEAIPWDVDGQKVLDLMKPGTVMSLLSTVTYFFAACVAIKTVYRKGLSTQQRVRNAANTAENIGGVLNYMSLITGSVVQFSASSIKAEISAIQNEQVERATKESAEYGKQLTNTHKNIKGHEHDVDVTKAIKNVGAMQERITDRELERNLLKSVESGISILGVLTGEMLGLATILNGAVKVSRWIYTFWANKSQRTSTLDEFLEMDELLNFFMDAYNNLDETTKKKYGSKESSIKDTLRTEVLRHMHFSTAEEFFEAITEQYATIMHWYIFHKESGEVILANETDEIKKRVPLCELFPGLKFEYPKTENDTPSPEIADITINLIRNVE